MGITVGQYARKTCLFGNTFEGVDQPLLDWGLRTFFLNNTRLRLDQQGHAQEPLPHVRSEREVRAGGLP